MSFFEDASLVLIPSAQKTSKVYSVKPTDGTGDLTFTRSNDTATRVGPDGLIEKVRTNLILQSETFDNASWVKDGATVTANDTTAPNGTATADKVVFSDSAKTIKQALNLGGAIANRSVYIKGTAGETISIDDIFVTAAVITLTGDWQRVNFTAAAPNGYGIGISTFGGATARTIWLWGAQVELGDIATDYIATTSAAVSVGPVANVPRLDYSGGSSCPRLLLEPQRTNLITFSENFDNAAWVKSKGGSTADLPIVTSNFGIAPDGTMSADRLVINPIGGTTGTHFSAITASFTALAADGVGSVYVKSTSGALQSIQIGGGFSALQQVGSEWTRIYINLTAGATTIQILLYGPVAGNIGTDILLWGAQAEAGAYATSYIPTLGAAVTRGADAASKTGISSLIGQTEGTLFFEIKDTENFLAYLGVDNLSTGTRILIYGSGDQKVYTQIRNSSTVVFGAQSAAISGAAKAAVSFNSSGSVFYVNGVQVATGSGTTYTNLSQLTFNHSSQVGAILNQALLFKTRLTNAQLAELTTI